MKKRLDGPCVGSDRRRVRGAHELRHFIDKRENAARLASDNGHIRIGKAAERLDVLLGHLLRFGQ